MINKVTLAKQQIPPQWVEVVKQFIFLHKNLNERCACVLISRVNYGLKSIVQFLLKHTTNWTRANNININMSLIIHFSNLPIYLKANSGQPLFLFAHCKSLAKSWLIFLQQVSNQNIVWLNDFEIYCDFVRFTLVACSSLMKDGIWLGLKWYFSCHNRSFITELSNETKNFKN